MAFGLFTHSPDASLMIETAPSSNKDVPSENVFVTHQALALESTPALLIANGCVQALWLNSFPSQGPPHQALTAQDAFATWAGRNDVRNPGTGPQSSE